MRHETAIFGPKNPNSEIPVIISLLCLILFQKQKTKICRNPYFYSVLANLKKDNFPKLTYNTEIRKTQFVHPFLKKAIFR